MAESVADRPKAPAAAYHAVAEALGPDYFLTAPPPAGIELRVEGWDGVRTVWRMSDAKARTVHAALKQSRDVRRLSFVTYAVDS